MFESFFADVGFLLLCAAVVVNAFTIRPIRRKQADVEGYLLRLNEQLSRKNEADHQTTIDRTEERAMLDVLFKRLDTVANRLNGEHGEIPWKTIADLQTWMGALAETIARVGKEREEDYKDRHAKEVAEHVAGKALLNAARYIAAAGTSLQSTKDEIDKITF